MYLPYNHLPQQSKNPLAVMESRLLLFLFALTLQAISQPSDTVRTIPVAPGVKHTSMVLPSFPLTANVVEVDLTNPLISVETVKAAAGSQETLFAREKTSSMATRKTNDSVVAICAVNGDFFEMNGMPVHIQIENGEVLKEPVRLPVKSIFGMTDDKKPFIGRFSLTSKVVTRQDSTIYIENINEICGSDQAILFNKYYGERTGTGLYGVVLQLHPISGSIVNDTIKSVVDTLIDLSGNLKIPQNGFVLIARGEARGSVLRNVSLRDTLKLLFQLVPTFGLVTQAIGGWPRIVRDGKNTVKAEADSEEAIPGLVNRRHPRTAVGYSGDGTKLYFVVVDGRQKQSAGMTLDELADFMIKLGVYQALNLDGGGSSTMVVDGKIVNSPSDQTGERPVSNAVVVLMRKKR